VEPENDVPSTMESNEYVVMEKRQENSSSDPIKTTTISGENRTSVFDDSDYDEVIDFLTSHTLESNSKVEAERSGNSFANVTAKLLHIYATVIRGHVPAL